MACAQPGQGIEEHAPCCAVEVAERLLIDLPNCSAGQSQGRAARIGDRDDAVTTIRSVCLTLDQTSTFEFVEYADESALVDRGALGDCQLASVRAIGKGREHNVPARADP